MTNPKCVILPCLALAVGCGKVGYEGAYPGSGTPYRQLTVSQDETVSVINTAIAFTVRRHGGTDTDGWISAFRDGIGGEEDNAVYGLIGFLTDGSSYMTGRVTAAQGELATAPDVLCSRLWFVRGSPDNAGIGPACVLLRSNNVAPASIAECPQSFMVAPVSPDKEKTITDREMADADIYIDDGCEGRVP